MPAGSRPGERRGGRQKGTPNRATVFERETKKMIQDAADAAGITPLEVLLKIMRAAWENKDFAAAHAAAKDAAPYVHPRLNSIDARVDQHTTHTIVQDYRERLLAEVARIAAAGDTEESDFLPNGGTTH